MTDSKKSLPCALSIPIPRLYVDLVPTSSWGDNVRSAVPPKAWKAIAEDVYERAGHRCSVCRGRGRQHAVEAHERWMFDFETQTQTLIDVIALCPTCHRTTHFGLARKMGFEGSARKQLAKVNGWTTGQVEEHIEQAFDNFALRSKIAWRVDISHLRVQRP